MDELLTLATTLDPRFKSRYNNDDGIKVITTAAASEPVAMATEEDSPTPGSSTGPFQAMAAEAGAGDDISEAAKIYIFKKHRNSEQVGLCKLHLKQR